MKKQSNKHLLVFFYNLSDILTQKTTARLILVFLGFTLFSLLVSNTKVVAQTSFGTSPNSGGTGNKADSNQKSVTRVNPATLALELSIPIANYPGRAGNSMPLVFNYSSKVWKNESKWVWWRPSTPVGGYAEYVTDTAPIYAEKTAAGWTSSIIPPRIDWEIELFDQEGKPWDKLYHESGIGNIWQATLDSFLNNSSVPSECLRCDWFRWQWTSNESGYWTCGRFSVDPFCQADPQPGPTPPPTPTTPDIKTTYYVKRIRVQLGDGATREFRKDDKVYAYCTGSPNDGIGNPNGNPYPCEGNGDFRTGVFTSVDGSRMRLEVDNTQTVLYMPDGSRYFWEPGVGGQADGHYANKLVDVNGNQMTFSRTTLSNSEVEQKWVDTMGREIIDPLPQNWKTQDQKPRLQPFSMKGINESSRNFKLNWLPLKPYDCEQSTDPNCGQGKGALKNQSESLSYVSDQLCEGNLTTPKSPALFTWEEQGTRICNNFYPVRNANGELVLDGNGNPIVDASLFNPVVLAEIELPNGQKYVFKYNRFGEIIRVDYPTGSYEEFEYGQVPMFGADPNSTYEQFNRGVTIRRIYENSQAQPLVWQYSAVNSSGPTGYITTVTNPDGSQRQTILNQSDRNEYGLYGFENPLSGAPVETKLYSAPMANGQRKLYSRNTTQWTFSEALPGGYIKAKRDTRALKQISILMEGEQALAQMTETIFENPEEPGSSVPTEPTYFARLNVKESRGYHFIHLDISTAQNATASTLASLFTTDKLATKSQTDYMYDSQAEAYRKRGIIGLPIQSRILDPISNEVIGKSEPKFDEVNIYPILDFGSTTGWVNPASDPKIQQCTSETGVNCANLRGKLTSSRSWVKETNSWIETHAQFDNFGNLRKTWDPVNNLTETEFSSDYYYAYPTKVITPAPDPNNTGHGTNQTSKVETTFDQTTGLITKVKNDYDQEAMTEYDVMLRQVRVAPIGQLINPINETIYDDENLTVTVRRQVDENNWNEHTTYLDRLGRTIKAREKDSQGDIVVETRYDNLGRILKTSEPYRVDSSGNPAEPIYWSKSNYDELNRVVENFVPTIDGGNQVSAGKTEYSLSTASNYLGTVIIGIDASGKKGRTITNGLGQIIRVDEPDYEGNLDPLPQPTPNPTPTPGPSPSPTPGGGECAIPDPNQCLNGGGVNYPMFSTYYKYNAQGQMVEVTQGNQKRFFLYDSLGRLIRIKQPEQVANPNLELVDPVTGNKDWSAAFSYDILGNLISSTDAKGTVITNVYDKANRIVTKTYSDSITPSVSFYYDGKGLSQVPDFSKGKLTKVTNSTSTTQYTSFDNFGRLLSSQQITDGRTFESRYKYNLSGNLIEQIYPDGRVVRNFLENDGDLAKVTSKASVGTVMKNYADSFSYTASGGISKMRFGNGRWETAQFNSRRQLVELGLGLSENDASLWKVNFEYGELQSDGSINASKNTGNIARQTITVPTTSFVQTYKYDAIDRLTEAKEITGGSGGAQNWLQTWNYDRYGNRVGFSQNIGGQPLVLNNLTNPTIDPNTNRFVTEQGYHYDAVGNLTRAPENKEYVFNGENKQIEVKDANAPLGSPPIGKYYYDGEGKRVKKETSLERTIFVYDGMNRLIAEYSTQLSQQPTISYLTMDHLGTPRVITDKSGNVVSRRDFMPFGEDLDVGVGERTEALKYGSSPDNIRQKFTGYQKDIETDLDFAQARYYNGRHGRFTAVDPLLSSGKSINPQTFNRYVYVGNNPLTRTDPNGLEWWWVQDKGSNIYRPKWFLDKTEAEAFGAKEGRNVRKVSERDHIFQGDITKLWFALNPNANEASPGYLDENTAKLKYGLWTDFKGGYDSVFDGNFSWGGILNTALPVKDFAYLVAYMKTGDLDGALKQFWMIAGTLAIGGVVGKYVVTKAFAAFSAILRRVVGSKAFNEFVRKGGAQVAQLLCCFQAGTLIRTDQGLKSVEKIKVGDKVLSYNEKTKQYEYKKVVRTFIGIKESLVKLRIRGEKKILVTSTEHPFYIRTFYKARDGIGSNDNEAEWLVSANLKTGDKLLRPNGKWTIITKIEYETKPTLVYNFEVEGNHNYFVGESGFLSHNCDLANRVLAKLNLYPKVIDPRTGRNILLPSVDEIAERGARVEWGNMQRAEFIAEWHRRGYSTPTGGWDKYDIHHIIPREYGGTNDFWNLVPVERETHKLFNAFWRQFGGL